MMLQGSLFQRLLFYHSPSLQGFSSAAKVNISRGEVIQAFMISLMVIIADELPNLMLQMTG